MQAPPPPEVMTRTINELARAETAAIIAELRDGGEAAWNAPTSCQGWVARDVVVHLIGAAQLFPAITRAALEGTPAPSVDPADHEARLAPLRQRSRDDLLAELERSGAEYASYLEGLDAGALSRPVTMPYVTLPAWQFDGIWLNELAVHHWDLRAPRDPGAQVNPRTLPVLVPLHAGALPLLAIGEKTDGAWQLDVSEPANGPFTVRVQDGQVTAQPGAASNADARLTLDGDAFLRLIWGRLDLAAAIDSGRVKVEGDRDRALALQRLYPGG
jgi:uncharacterized protein (TIGR03083 family)